MEHYYKDREKKNKQNHRLVKSISIRCSLLTYIYMYRMAEQKKNKKTKSKS